VLNEESLDTELVEYLRQDHIEAYDLIFKRYGVKLFSFAMKYLKSREESEELVQEVFLKIWENRKNLKKEYSFKSYLFTLSYHQLCRFFRKRNYRLKLEKELSVLSPGSYSMDDRLDYQSILEQVDLLIDKLPPRQKAIFVKSRKEGKTSREIAREMNLVPGTVDNQISDALKFIRKNLGNNLAHMLFITFFLQ